MAELDFTGDMPETESTLLIRRNYRLYEHYLPAIYAVA